MRPVLAGTVWPWMIAEVDAHVRNGHTLPAAVLGIALHGPPALRAAAGEAQRVWSATGDAVAALRALQERAADPRVDRLCETAVAMHLLDDHGAPALERLRASADDDARRDREVRRARSAAWFAVVFLAAVVALCATISGVGVVGIVAACAVTSGMAACVLAVTTRRVSRVRVFGTQPGTP